jgi:hypothetical protein
MAQVRQHPTYPQYRMKVGVMPDFSGSDIVTQEEPVGAKDGVNKVFTLSRLPIPNSEWVFKDGMFMRKGVDNDYTINGKQITFAEPPDPKSVIAVTYKTMDGVGGS